METIVVGKSMIGSESKAFGRMNLHHIQRLMTSNRAYHGTDYSMTEFDDASYLTHQVRRMLNGYRELRSRFFIAADNHGNTQLGHDLAVYYNIEMICK